MATASDPVYAKYCIFVQYIRIGRSRRSPLRRCGSSSLASVKSKLRRPNLHGTIAPLVDLFGSSRSLLRHPVWYSDTASETVSLPLSADDYRVTPAVGPNDRWTVTSSSGEVVYRGIGPVTVTQG